MTREEFSKDTASEITAGFGNKPELLVQILHAFMDRFGFISEDAVRLLAENLNISRADVHGVVSYYHDFRTAPAARHIVKICAAEACQAMGSRELVAHAEQALGLSMHESNDEVTLEPVYCLGNCACSPAIMVDGKTLGRVTAKRFDAAVAALGGGKS
jgi:formate dehydrogenase subunit gamma